VIDDATSKFWARFAEQDTTEENLRTLGGWLERYGRPLAHYTDKNSIFRTTRRAGIGEQLQGERARSQFGRALKELGLNGSPRKVAGQRSHRAALRDLCRTAW